MTDTGGISRVLRHPQPGFLAYIVLLCFFGLNPVYVKEVSMKNRRIPAAVCTLLFFLSLFCFAQDNKAELQTTPSVQKNGKPPVIYLDPQKMIKVHMKKKWVEIPAVTNIRDGFIELALGSTFTGNCRSHESMFITRVKPSLLHAGFKLIGLKPGKPVEADGQSKLPAGDGVYIYVVWKDKGKITCSRLEKLIFNKLAEEPVTDIKWIFTGSRFVRIEAEPRTEGTKKKSEKSGEKPKMKTVYEADIDGTLIATWHWGATIIDIPLPEGANDEAFDAYAKTMPPLNTPVRFVFSREEIPEKKIIQEYSSGTFTVPWEEKKKDKIKETKTAE